MNDQSLVGRMIQVCVRPEDVKKVRGLILSLAISGKLTPKEVNSEDISGTFVIPSDWKWCILSEIAACRGSAKAGSDGIKPSDWILDMEDIDGATGTIHTRATFKERSSLSTKSAFKPGDVLYGKLRPYLNKVVLADSPGFCTTEIIPITPGATIESRYLQLVLRSPYFLTYVAKRSYGMKMPRLGTKDLESARIPLPPLGEQKRIVAKVDELMALCDRLEAQLKERDIKQAALAKAALAKFTEDPTPENLQLLFHPSFSIEPAELKKLVLSLAIQGRLLPQDEKDTPAAFLISRIAELRSGRKCKIWPPVDPNSFPFEIPHGWSVVRLGNLAISSESGWSPQCEPQKRIGNGWGVLKVSAVSWGGFDPEANKSLPGNMEPRTECEVKPGDFLISRANTEELVARSVVVENTPARLMLSDKIVRFTFPDEIDKGFINLANLSEPSRSFYMRHASGTSSSMKNVGRDVMCSLPIALPPLAEQRRITEKVQLLMGIIEQLEAQLEASRTTGEKLLEAMVAELTSA